MDGVHRFPFAKYLPPGASTVISFAGLALQQWLNQFAWFPTLPWAALLLAVGGWLFGTAYADLLNPHSRLRLWWRDQRKLFDLTNVFASHLPDPERVDIVCLLKFHRACHNPLLTVRVSMIQAGKQPKRIVIVQRRLGEVVQDASVKLTLASLSITGPGDKSARHSVWGEAPGGKDIAEGQFTVIGNSRTMIEVAVDHQVERVFAQFHDPRGHAAGLPHARNRGAVLTLHCHPRGLPLTSGGSCWGYPATPSRSKLSGCPAP